MSTDKISGDSPKKFIPNPSQGDYWGGYMVDGGGGLYNFIVVFLLGILGLDKVALRAPLTAAFKFFVNVATFGSWAVYDWIQTWGDKEFVTKYGYSNPFGPDGHGYNMVSNMSSLGAAPLKPSGFGLFLYYIYVISCLVLPIGIGNMIAGDVTGGLAKLVSCMAFITIPVYIIMGYIEFATSGTIEQKGVPRTFPMYPLFFLKDKHPAAFILPQGNVPSTPLAPQKGGDTQITSLPTPQVTVNDPPPNPQVIAYEKELKQLVAQGEQPVVPGLISSLTEAAGKALTNYPPIKAFQTVSAAAEGVEAVSKMGTELSKEFSKNPKALLSAVGVNLPATPSITAPEVPKDLTKLAAAAAGGAYQTGGSLAVYPEMDNLLMGGMAVLVVGGLVAAFFRKISFSTKTDDNEYPRKTYERDDAPPVPGGV